MKHVRIVNVCLVIFIISFLLPEYGYGMKTHFVGRVADPVTGESVEDAQVFVLLAGSMEPADIFADSQGEVPLSNPVIADVGGRYGFYAPNGKYRLRILSPGAVLLYDHDDVSICDPRKPRTIKADELHPALSLYTPVPDGNLNIPFMIEKRDENENLVGARWRVQTHMGEVGFGNFYNTRRRAGIPNVQDLYYIDSASEPPLTWGTNDGDDGILGIPGFYISGGGLWLGDAHIATFDLRLPVPQGDDPAGVVVFMNAPAGLVKGDVVALDTSARLRVQPVSIRGELLPFVVAKVDGTRTFVMVRGLAWAKVNGPVEPGDILVTSSQPLCAERSNANSDPSRSLGVAVSQVVEGKVLVRILRTRGMPREARGPTPSDEATDVSALTDLSWQPGAELTDQDVYFGTDPCSLGVVASGDGTLATVSNATLGGPLEPLTTYYWKVDGEDTTEPSSFPGTVWSFTTTESFDVVNISPADGETGLVNPTLEWSGHASVDSYDVYLGTDPGSLVKVDTVVSETYPTSGLSTFTWYYWQIVALDGSSNPIATGPVWSFRTAMNPPIGDAIGVSVGGTGFVPADVAGAPGYRQSNWNSAGVTNNSAGPVNGSIGAGSVIDSAGAVVAGSVVTWSAQASWTPWTPTSGTADDNLHDMALIARNGTSTITVTNIPYDKYNVVVYQACNHFDRGVEVSVVGHPDTYVSQPTNAGFDGTYTQVTSTTVGSPTVGGNYSVHQVVTGATCTINWTPHSAASWPDAGFVTGFQIVSMLPRKSDFNYDWSVDLADLALFVQVWLNIGESLPQDLNSDNKVNLNDFALFAEEWLKE